MKTDKRILLINKDVNLSMKSIIKSTAKKVGRGLDIKNKDLLKQIKWNKYDVTIIDESAVENVAQIIKYIKRKDTKNKIVIFSHDPTWRRARDYFIEGASEYTKKSEKEIYSAIKNCVYL